VPIVSTMFICQQCAEKEDVQPDELRREKTQLLADITTAQTNITSLLEHPLDGQDWQSEQVYTNLVSGIARTYARIAEIDAEPSTPPSQGTCVPTSIREDTISYTRKAYQSAGEKTCTPAFLWERGTSS